MLRTLSATCVAIALADKRGTLRLVECVSRFGDTFISIEDAHGIIEVADDLASAEARIAELRERAR